MCRSLYRIVEVRRLHARHLRVDLFRPEQLFSQTGVAARGGLTLIVYTLAWVATVPGRLENLGFVVLASLINIAAVSLYVVPLFRLHGLLVSEKRRRIGAANESVRTLSERVHAAVASNELSEMDALSKGLAALQTEIAVLERASTWPWHPELSRVTVTAVGGPQRLRHTPDGRAGPGGALVIRSMMPAETDTQRFLEVLRVIFLLIAAGGFIFYAVDHWVVEHFTLEHWTARIPLWVSVVGAPLTILLFFARSRLVIYPFLLWMVISVLTGLLGALLHLFFNAETQGVSVFTLSGFAAAMDGFRPVLAALAHTHVGFVGLIAGLTFEELPWNRRWFGPPQRARTTAGRAGTEGSA